MSELSENAAIVAGDPNSPSREWLSAIAASEKKYKEWHTRGDRVIKRYKDERSDREAVATARGRKMNLLWSNVETTKPALYSQTPTPNISRRNKDADPVGRWASVVLERCVVASLDSQDFDFTMRSVVADLLLPGRGIAIEEYVPTIEKDAADLTTESDETGAEVPEKVTQQKTITRYLHWKDCLTNLARIWEEVWWFGYRSFLTKDEVREKWGDEVADNITLDHRERDEQGRFQGNGKEAKATIWTVWDKRHKRVIMVAPGYPDQLLDDFDPPVEFDDFFPIPRPVQATTATDSIIPTPDFAMYQDQADEVDLLTNRIYKLAESLKLRGLYPADMDSLKRLMTDTSDTDMIPVDSWAMMMDRGGANGLVIWFPLKDVATTLEYCINAREKAKEALYEVTGISDIIRGSSDPDETATAQGIKSSHSMLRTRDRQRDIQRFARDLVRKKAAVIAEHFSLESLQQMSGVKLLTNQQKQTIQQFLQVQQAFQQVQQQYQQQAQMAQQQGMPPPPQPQPPAALTVRPPTPDMLKLMDEPSWDDVTALLQNDKLRGFLIDIETDSTVEPDQEAEQAKAVQFTEAIAQFLTVAGPILEQQPTAAPMLGEMLMLVARRFKAGETVETSIEKFVASVSQQGPKPPDPKVQAIQAKSQADQTRAQTSMAGDQVKLQTTQIKAGAEKTKAELGIAQTIAEHHTTMAEHAADLVVAQTAAQQPNGQASQ